MLIRLVHREHNYVSEMWSHQWRFGGVQPPPRQKFRRPSKIVPDSTLLRKLLKIDEFRTPTTQDVRKKGSKILKTTVGSQLFYISNDK